MKKDEGSEYSGKPETKEGDNLRKRKPEQKEANKFYMSKPQVKCAGLEAQER